MNDKGQWDEFRDGVVRLSKARLTVDGGKQALRLLEASLNHNGFNNKKAVLMNFELVLKYFGVLTSVALTLEAASAEIAAGASATTPPIAATLEGKHGTLSLVWNPTTK